MPGWLLSMPYCAYKGYYGRCMIAQIAAILSPGAGFYKRFAAGAGLATPACLEVSS